MTGTRRSSERVTGENFLCTYIYVSLHFWVGGAGTHISTVTVCIVGTDHCVRVTGDVGGSSHKVSDCLPSRYKSLIATITSIKKKISSMSHSL